MLESMCKLCKSRVADKKNSHIIPKFLGKSLFGSEELREPAVSINRKGKERVIQDTPKEDHILCSYCEQRMSIIEICLAPFFKDIKRYTALSEKFVLKSSRGMEYIECENIHPTLYKLFIYSLVWRSSISNLFYFRQFKLSEEVEESLRVFLDSNLTEYKKTLIDSLDSIVEIPLFHNYMMQPKFTNNNSRGVFSVCRTSESSYLLLLVHFGLGFFTDEDSLIKELKAFTNKQNEKVIVFLGSNEAWHDLNRTYFYKMVDSNIED